MLKTRSFKKARLYLRIALWLTLPLLAGGIMLPLVTVQKFLVAEHTVSIIGGLIDLAAQGQWFIFSVITVFSLFFPLWKLYAMHRALAPGLEKRRYTRYVAWISAYGKWSMLDVFAAALLVVIVKLDMIATIHLHTGAYLFFAAVLLSMALSTCILRIHTTP